MWHTVKQGLLCSLLYCMFTTGLEYRYGLKWVSEETPGYWVGSWLIVMTLLIVVDYLYPEKKQ